jgi:hypothetical protein
MRYPKELLPRRKYQLFSVEDLAEPSYLARRSLKNQNEFQDYIGDIRVEALVNPVEDFYGLSTNLLGVFHPKHLRVQITEDKKALFQYWHPGAVTPKARNIKCTEDDSPVFYFQVGSLHNIQFPYEMFLPKGKGIIRQSGICKVIHKPMLVNFWHFELTVYDPVDGEIKKRDTAWKKMWAEHFIKSTLLINASTIEPAFKMIPKNVYKRPWFNTILLTKYLYKAS